MAGAFDKQPSSYLNVYQNIQCVQGAATASAKFGNGTQQIRVLSQLPCWGSVNQTTADATASQASIAGGTGMMLTGGSTTNSAVSLYSGAFPEYFVVRPGQIFIVASTSTSSFAVSVTECA